MRSDRLWQLGGALCAAAIVAFGWFFFINPKYQEADDIRARVDDAGVQVAVQQQKLAQLRKDNEHLEEYKAQLAADLAALPEADSVSSLLRELQAAGELTGVTVSGVTVGSAVDVKTAGATVHALPVSLSVVGPSGKINPFLDQLQKVQPRAVLISSVNLAPSTTAGDRTNVTINLQAFYAPTE
ncbi:hypothetical protein GCM10010399_04920 [Dactylosporangium fulvum]|uniref:Type 4a pilus biogenesis protein PilO n=1 Tax=Dactylosporangium fulvum TaxID=53359 RepID=A0ABY5VX17_9ACTN|nr:type 4a pilus biogenesis protein PilO [Dactylosporangium fulvum]UWP81344.1 type 4a pilus biogenesis protein PilO [Dactylosporangium fulvum]